MAAAYYINVAEWTAENVAEWLGGLDDAIFPYAHFFINNQIDGRHLLTLLPDDLKNLNITKIGHQEIILDAVDLLRQLHYTLTTETLQSIALRVGCKARSLYNDLKRNGPKEIAENGKQARISVSILSAVSDILIAVKAFISWLDRYPFESEKQYVPIRKVVLKLSIELASTAQRDQFAEKPHDVIKESVLNLAELCDTIIQSINDSLIIQPATLDIVTVKRKPDEEWGLHIDSSYNGVLVVGNVKYQSPAHRNGKVEVGDEIIQVNYQTVVGWQLKKLVYSMCEHATEVHLTLKKRPRHANLLGQVIVTKPYRIPSRKTALARHHKWSDSNCSLHIQEGFPTIRAPIATGEADEEDDSAFLPEVTNNPNLRAPNLLSNNGAPTPYQIFPAKSRVTVQRRATVSGASPTIMRAPVNIQDLVTPVSQLTKELVFRSISHDPTKHIAKNRSDAVFLSQLKTIQAEESEEAASKSHNGSPVNKPHIEEKPTRPAKRSDTASTKSASSGMSASGSDADSGIMDEKSWSPVKNALQTFEEEYSSMEKKFTSPEEQLRKIVGLIASPTTKPPSLTSLEKVGLAERKHSSNSSISSEQYNKSENMSQILEEKRNEKSKYKPVESRTLPQKLSIQTHDKKGMKIIQDSSPIMRKKTHGKFASRRVSCKDIGQGDCQGWLHKRKDGKRLFSGPKWSKRWVILKKQYLYCYLDKDDLRAECLMFLPGFTVSPASDCKTKKYAFKLHSPSASFMLASDSLSDMTKWMNKMGLAAISYPSLGMQKSPGDPQDVYFSETDEENEDAFNNRNNHSSSPSLNSVSSVDSSPNSSTFLLPMHQNSPSPESIKGPSNNLSPLRSTSSSSINKTDISRGHPVSPKQPNTAMKFTYPKPLTSALISSPKKTVAEKPLEKSTPNAAKPTTSAPKSNRYSGSWNDNQSANNSSGYDQNSLDSMRSSVGTSPLSFCSYDSSSSETPSPRLPPHNHKSPVYPQRQSNSPVRMVRPAAQQFYPNRAPFAIQTGTKSNVRCNQSASASTILRCSSLQKLNSSNDIYSEINDRSATGQMQQQEFVSVLDREYRKLYGQKKPETITSPNHESNEQSPERVWWNNSNSMVRSATSRQIHSLYTRDSYTSSPDQAQAMPSEMVQPEDNNYPIPTLPQKSPGSKFLVSGVNSMGRITGNKKEVSPGHKPVPPPKCDSISSLNIGSRNPSVSSTTSQSSGHSDTPSKPSKFSLTKQFSPKSPSSTFRFFSSPKFVRKFTSPKLERKPLPPPPNTVPSGTQTTPTHYSDGRIINVQERQRPPPPPTGPKPQKAERTFLGSPKLARAFFGSPKQTRKTVNTATTAVQTEHTFDELVRLHQQNARGHGDGREISSSNLPSEDHDDKMKRCNSNSSLTSNASATAGSSQFYVETRIRPQITISLPLVTEASVDERSDSPDTPRTPTVKPTMGVSMLGKKRSPSTSSELTDRSRMTPIDGEAMDEQEFARHRKVEEEMQRSLRSEIRVVINGEERLGPSAEESFTSSEDDEVEVLMNSLRTLGLTPDGTDLEDRRRRTMLNPCQENSKINQMILDLRALQRTLKDHELEASAIEELFSVPVNSHTLQDWICRYNHLLPPDYC